MADKGLLFIPDISGFTHFVNQTEVDHSRYIIRELLETLINSNQLQLQISEIEGDAILFYRFGEIPSFEEIYNQVSSMFCNFHRHLKTNAARRICLCNACKQADTLTLKVITHGGIFSTYDIREFKKLIGADVITAHQLLKNDIPLHEYWLVTDSLLKHKAEDQSLPNQLQWEKGSKETEAGQIDFFYSLLTPLKEKLRDVKANSIGIKGKRVKVLSLQKEYDENMQRLFAVIGDISHRPAWMEGLKIVKNISSPINRIGTSHHCVLDKNFEVMTTSDFHSDDYTIVIEETDKKKIFSGQYQLQKNGEEKTLLTVNFFLKKNFFIVTAFKLFMKKSYTKKLLQTMENLAKFLKTNEATTCHC